MHEILKLLNLAGCDPGEVMFFRLGTSGGLGRKCTDILKFTLFVNQLFLACLRKICNKHFSLCKELNLLIEAFKCRLGIAVAFLNHSITSQ